MKNSEAHESNFVVYIETKVGRTQTPSSNHTAIGYFVSTLIGKRQPLSRGDYRGFE